MGGQCKCTCKRGVYSGKTLNEASMACKNEGGTTDSTEVCRCNCQYDGETVQVEQAKQNCALKVPTQSDSNGKFSVSNGKCSCVCGAMSEAHSIGKAVTARVEVCPSPQKFEIKDQACKCFCGDNTHPNKQGK